VSGATLTSEDGSAQRSTMPVPGLDVVDFSPPICASGQLAYGSGVRAREVRTRLLRSYMSASVSARQVSPFGRWRAPSGHESRSDDL
jgi:hypothetical protein